jgi:hypothetical protein
MRNGQNKRMRGRNHHHHRKNQNPLTRVYESNGPEVKIRGTASHIAEKYVQLARDAMASGDPVTAENYHQHAEHYFRLIAAAQEQFRQQNPYYRPEGEIRDEIRDDATEEIDDTSRDSPQGQPQFGGPFPTRDAQPYPAREPQPYIGRDQPPQQSRLPHQQPQPPQGNAAEDFESDGERLPAFITGQPQQNYGQNGGGYDGQSGERYQMHRRRRRHRGHHHRPDLQGGGQPAAGRDAPEDPRRDND